MRESLDLFEGLVNLPWFKDAPIILFLNKDDLFKRKIETVDIGIYFPQYTGGTEYSLGLKFIQDEYFARNLNEQKTICQSEARPERCGEREREIDCNGSSSPSSFLLSGVLLLPVFSSPLPAIRRIAPRPSHPHPRPPPTLSHARARTAQTASPGTTPSC